MSGVGVLEVLCGSLQIRVEVLDNLVDLHGFGVVLPQILQLLPLVRGQSIDVLLARHVDIRGYILVDLDPYILEVVRFLIRPHSRRAEDDLVLPGSASPE